jgi:predicted N-acetyltransferase YhbS
LIVIAEENTEVIGCSHAQIRDFQISQKVTTQAAQTGDLFVRRDHRRRGIATNLTRALRKQLIENGAIILFGVATPETHRDFYSKLKGVNVFVIPQHFYQKTLYHKNLNCASFKQKAETINTILNDHPEIRDELMNIDLRVLVRLKGYPQFSLTLSEGQISIHEDEPVTQPNMVITASRIPSPPSLLTFMKMALSGDLKVKGLRNVFTIYKCYKILQRINRIK